MGNYTAKLVKSSSEPMLYRILWDTREECPAGSQVGPEVRSLYLIECNVSGYGSVRVNNKDFKVGPRCCYILRPGDAVTLYAAKTDPKIALWCLFGGAMVGQILDAAGITADQPFAPEDKFDELFAILEKLHAVRLQTDMGSELVKTAYLYEFLSVLTRGRADAAKDIVCERAKSIMESEYARDISISDIASELGFDRAYFSILFKEYSGISPYAYLTGIRIRRACDLLNNSTLSISEIAEKVGIDPHNFARIFKRELGVSPNDYRK